MPGLMDHKTSCCVLTAQQGPGSRFHRHRVCYQGKLCDLLFAFWEVNIFPRERVPPVPRKMIPARFLECLEAFVFTPR